MGRRKSIVNLSKYQKIYARILSGRGFTQEKIAAVLDVTQGAISQLKKKEGDWEEYQIPSLTLQELVKLILEQIAKLLLQIRSEDVEDESRAVQDCMRLASTMENIQKQVDSVTVRDEMLTCQHLMEWLVKNPRENPLEAIQEYHDLKQGEL